MARIIFSQTTGSIFVPFLLENFIHGSPCHAFDKYLHPKDKAESVFDSGLVK